MSASNEWEEWHLTPQGWMAGTAKTDFNRTDVIPPENRVATFCYTEHLSSAFSKMESTWEKAWGTNDAEIEELLEKFGKFPTEHISNSINR